MFQEGESRNSRSFRLNEIWLLILRMLAISILVLILAELRFEKNNSHAKIAYYFEENLLQNERILAMADSLSEESKVLLFKDGFPEFEKDLLTAQNKIPDYWQLARSLEKERFDSVVVFSAGYANGLRGKKPGISKNINWIQIDQNDSIREPLAYRNTKDAIQIIYGVGNSQRLFYEKQMLSQNGENLDSIPEIWTEPYRIQIFAEDSLKSQLKYFHSAVNAIRNYTRRAIEFDTIAGNELKSDADLLIWISNSESPEFNNKILALHENEYAEDLIIPGSTENEYFITQTISAKNIQNYKFTEDLLNLIIPSEEIMEFSKHIDKRKVSEALLETKFIDDGKRKTQIRYFDISGYLWMLLFALLAGERILAKIRRQ